MINRVDPDYSGARVVQWLEYIKTHDFAVGDYLVRHVRDYPGNNWIIERFSKKSDEDVWRKYKVTYKCPLGIPYVQKVNMDGSLCNEQFPLVNTDLSSYQFEIDPDYETYILLGKEEEYSPQGKFFDRWKERAIPSLKALSGLKKRAKDGK